MSLKELFNQLLVTNPNPNYRIALGLPGQDGAFNIEYSVFVDLITILTGITEWGAKNYNSRAIVINSDQLYILNGAVSLPFNSTNFASELTAGTWMQLTFELSQNSGTGTDVLMSQDIITTLLDDKVDKVLGKGLSDNNFTTPYKDKLDSLNEHYRGTFLTVLSLTTTIPLGNAGDEAIVDPGIGIDSKKYLWDNNDLIWVEGGGSTIVVDLSVVDGSTNAVSGNAVYDALVLKATLASPTFTGTPNAPTATQGTSTTQLATTAFVSNELTAKGTQYEILFFGEITGFISFANTADITIGNVFAKKNIQSFNLTPDGGGSPINIVTAAAWNPLPINIPSGVYTWTLTYIPSTSQGVLHFKTI